MSSQEMDHIRFLLREIKATTEYVQDLDLTNVVDCAYARKAVEQVLVKMTAVNHNLEWILEARRKTFALPFRVKKKP